MGLQRVGHDGAPSTVTFCIGRPGCSPTAALAVSDAADAPYLSGVRALCPVPSPTPILFIPPSQSPLSRNFLMSKCLGPHSSPFLHVYSFLW